MEERLDERGTKRVSTERPEGQALVGLGGTASGSGSDPMYRYREALVQGPVQVQMQMQGRLQVLVPELLQRRYRSSSGDLASMDLGIARRGTSPTASSKRWQGSPAGLRRTKSPSPLL
jgi:hypothetical protein